PTRLRTSGGNPLRILLAAADPTYRLGPVRADRSCHQPDCCLIYACSGMISRERTTARKDEPRACCSLHPHPTLSHVVGEEIQQSSTHREIGQPSVFVHRIPIRHACHVIPDD